MSSEQNRIVGMKLFKPTKVNHQSQTKQQH